MRATATATFGHLKQGLILYPGAALAGEVTAVPLGVPDVASAKAGYSGEIITEARVRSLMPARAADAHKGTFGHLLVVGGFLGKTGAAAMVGQAAMRVGTGLVTLATEARAQPTLESKCLETMVEPIVDHADAPQDDKAKKRMAALLEGKRAVALGPGLSTGDGATQLALQLLQTATVPIVIDADGINILAENIESAEENGVPVVLTPHPGEMARLMKSSVADVQADRIGVSKEVAKRLNAEVVLKGAHSVVASPDGAVYVNPTGNAGMASGGVGDVLTGIIVSFLAQGLEPLVAALVGVYLHGAAGDYAAAEVGERSLVASDLITALPDVLVHLEG